MIMMDTIMDDTMDTTKDDTMDAAKTVFDFYEDSNHEWLKVSLVTLQELKIEEETTQHSYVSGDWVYLDEDSDCYKFITSMDERGTPIDTEKDIKEHHTDGISDIGNFCRYQNTLKDQSQCL